ncbi:hypothetical protein V496_00800 [Pseudogymnoascus sp. VKM F-4515 (FW-2607)]|nr:hypothetical protein V496_00800 [Pseudogymnoascus sp. VKM F-4515 (FW-2607)]
MPEDLTENSTVHDAKTHNLKIIFGWGTCYDLWHLSENIIAFSDGGARRNWKHFADTRDLATFSEALAERMDKPPGKDSVAPNIRIIMCITWTESWVGKPTEHWKNNPWHVWAVAIRPSQEFTSGKEVFIYDCNTEIKYKNIIEEDSRINTTKLYKQDLLSMQFKLLKHIHNHRGTIRRVYMGGHGNEGEGICFKLTGNWIRRMAATTATCLPTTVTGVAEQRWREVDWQNKAKRKAEEEQQRRKQTLRRNTTARPKQNTTVTTRKRKAEEAVLDE